jgi:hypothetical protein
MADQHFAIGYQLAHAFPNGPWIRPPGCRRRSRRCCWLRAAAGDISISIQTS